METSLIHFSLNNLEIVTARHVLHEAGIQTFVVNKTDSVYPGVFDGNIELFVAREDAEEAKKILIANDLMKDDSV